MADDGLTDDQHEAQAALHDLVQRHAALLGPEMDGDEDEGTPMVMPVLAEWVFIGSWQDLDSGEAFTTRITSRGLPSPHRTGLLHQALFQFGD